MVLKFLGDVYTAVVGEKSASGEDSCNCVRLTVIGLVLLGLIKVLEIDLTLLRAIKYLTFKSNPKKYGSWAVVTGATDGIGLAMAKRLAKKGLNIVVIGRDATKVAAAETELTKYKIQSKGIVADMSQAESFTRIAEELKDVPVGILVNNVGRSYDSAEYLTGISDGLVESLIALNITATTKMTRLVLPGMIERKSGAIINVSSAAGSLPVGDPLYAVYSGTKAYVDAFSKSLHYELQGKRIFVQAQVPYFVATKLSKIRTGSLAAPVPDQYAASAVNSIGYGAYVVPYWVHALQHAVIHSLPVSIVAKFILAHHFGIRARALKKAAKAAAGDTPAQTSKKVE